MGGHHDRARALDADRARRACRVRARLIRARTGEGRARAKANGVKLGRKPTLTPHQRQEAKRRVKARKETVGEIARMLQRQPVDDFEAWIISMFEMKTLTNYSDKSLLTEMRRVANEFRGRRLTRAEFDKFSKVHSATLVRRFGSWNEALDRATISTARCATRETNNA